ncbi:hypothetical protein HDV00_006107 [Rhizophlyctis rosea]|nr:hypothetical protein HDV00_006107 [Rhizophlyctis rosea]
MYGQAQYDPDFVVLGPGALAGLNWTMGYTCDRTANKCTSQTDILLLTDAVNAELLRRDAKRQSADHDILFGDAFYQLRGLDLEHALCNFQRYLRYEENPSTIECEEEGGEFIRKGSRQMQGRVKGGGKKKRVARTSVGAKRTRTRKGKGKRVVAERVVVGMKSQESNLQY